jgi:hypothetical protein
LGKPAEVKANPAVGLPKPAGEVQAPPMSLKGIPVVPPPSDGPNALTPAAAVDLPTAPATGPVVPPAPLSPPAAELPPPAAGKPTAPPMTLNPIAAPPSGPPAATPPVPVVDPLVGTPSTLKPAPTPPAVTVPDGGITSMEIKRAGLSKFRIILRVGEGEPSFEVRQGDDLMMKVVCEKVDVKSPEKGTGPSAVKAMGKVRFVGFGAEGTCDELSFLAGTGEVAMSGTVKVQVKDKLGRVESELTSDKLHYRLDTGSLPVGLK